MTLGILGGGFSGLALAYLYERPSEVLEAASELGGHCRSHVKDGFRYDEGGHILFSRDRGVLLKMLEVLDGNVREHRRNNKVWYKRRFVKYPFENGLGDLDPEDAYECLIHYIQDRYPEPANFREWIYCTFGRGIAERYLIPYNEKIWKTGFTLMTTDWAGARVPRPPLEDVVKSALGIPTEGYTHQLNFFYPESGGFEALPRALAERASARSKVVTDFPVRRVRRADDGWAVSDGRRERRYERIACTMPVQELLPCLPAVPREVEKAAAALRYNPSIFVMLGLRDCLAKDQTSVYFPQPELLFHRVVFPHSFDAECAPPGMYCAIAEISTPGEAGWWLRSDEEIIARVIADLAGEGFLRAEDVVTTDVKRVRYSYVVYDLDYQRNVETVRSYVRGLGIELLGRFAEFEYWNTDQCFASALPLAERLNGEKAGAGAGRLWKANGA